MAHPAPFDGTNELSRSGQRCLCSFAPPRAFPTGKSPPVRLSESPWKLFARRRGFAQVSSHQSRYWPSVCLEESMFRPGSRSQSVRFRALAHRETRRGSSCSGTSVSCFRHRARRTHAGAKCGAAADDLAKLSGPDTPPLTRVTQLAHGAALCDSCVRS